MPFVVARPWLVDFSDCRAAIAPMLCLRRAFEFPSWKAGSAALTVALATAGRECPPHDHRRTVHGTWWVRLQNFFAFGALGKFCQLGRHGEIFPGCRRHVFTRPMNKTALPPANHGAMNNPMSDQILPRRCPGHSTVHRRCACSPWTVSTR